MSLISSPGHDQLWSRMLALKVFNLGKVASLWKIHPKAVGSSRLERRSSFTQSSCQKFDSYVDRLYWDAAFPCKLCLLSCFVGTTQAPPWASEEHDQWPSSRPSTWHSNHSIEAPSLLSSALLLSILAQWPCLIRIPHTFIQWLEDIRSICRVGPHPWAPMAAVDIPERIMTRMKTSIPPRTTWRRVPPNDPRSRVTPMVGIEPRSTSMPLLLTTTGRSTKTAVGPWDPMDMEEHRLEMPARSPRYY